MGNRTWRAKWKMRLAGALAMCMAAGLLALPTGMAPEGMRQAQAQAPEGMRLTQAQEMPEQSNPRAVPMEQGESSSERLRWSFDESNGTLTISGKGDMPAFWDYVDSWHPSSPSTGDAQIHSGYLDGSKEKPWKNYKFRKLVITDGVTSIGINAFSNSSDLEEVSIPGSVTKIGFTAFKSCKKLKNIAIPDSVTSIEGGAFADCVSLTSVSIPSGVTRIGNSAFGNCVSLTGIEIPGSVTDIGGDAFADCSSLTDIEIPDGVTEMSFGIFYGCSSLKNVTIPAKVTSIEGFAFYGCSSLTGIHIPADVTSIGDNVFYGCKSLEGISVDAKNRAYYAEEGILYTRDLSKLIACPATKKGNVTLPIRVTGIEYGAFANCTELSSVTIPASVTKIGHYWAAEEYCSAFYDAGKQLEINYTGSEEQWIKVENSLEVEREVKAINYNYAPPATPTQPQQPGTSQTPGTSQQPGTPQTPGTSQQPGTPQNPPSTGGQTGTQNPPSTGGTAGTGNSSQKPTEQIKPSLPVITQTTVTATVGANSAPVKIEVTVTIESAVANLLSQIATQGKPEITTKESAPAIDQNVLQSAKNQKKDIAIAVTNNAGDLMYSWSFSGQNLDPSKVTKPMNLTMSFDTEKKDEIEKQTGIKSGLYLAINGYEGVLPGPATVRTYVGDKYANGETVYVYYYNEDKKSAEMPVQGQGNACKVESGYITYTLTHCSIYFVSNQEPSKYGIQDEGQAPQAQQPTQSSPKTGDSAATEAWAFAVAVSAAAVGRLWRRREYFAR